MDGRTLRVLEFHKVRERLAGTASNGLGRDVAARLEPACDFHEVQRRQRETSEARRILSEHPSVPLGGIRDIRAAVTRARAGSVLSPDELLDIASTLAAAARLRKFLFELGQGFEIICGHAARITPEPALVREIERCLDERGGVVDSASPQLGKIRAEIRATNGRVRDKLDSMIRSRESSRYLQEPVVTIRNGRFVVPVRQDCRAAVPGIVHDQSASGLTLFVEPMAVVDLNNQLAGLTAREREEVERILRELSSLVQRAQASILETLDALASTDFALAKGRLSLEMDATEPELETSSCLEIRQGRHPLLSGDVVPIDVELGDRFRTLVITGPNTGGKTVTLKTIGLFAIMTAAGLHLPAAPGTRYGVFEKVFADIGDEQSIEQNLSTFSSHVTHIVEILAQADPGSLVLLDELGAGTDPAEGASLGIAILEYLHARGARTAATTHYSELKVFAYEREGVENASCEFDVATLRPTYRLLLGLPGGSCALAVASRLGVPEEVIETARARLGEKRLRVDEMIAQVERTQRELDEDRELAGRAKDLMERLARERDAEVRRLKDARSEILAKAREQAAGLVAKARRDVALVLEELRNTSGDRAAIDDAARRAREAIKRVAEEQQALEEQGWREAAAPGASGLVTRPLCRGEVGVGSLVFVPRLGRTGRVLETPRESEDVEVQVGAMKAVVPLRELAYLETDEAGGRPEEARPGVKAAPAGEAHFAPVAREKAATISSEIDLRGLTVDEAITEVDKYLDDACLAGLARARIIHGKGTGALRQAVRDFVKAHPQVRDIVPAMPQEGGEGVTVVEIRTN